MTETGIQLRDNSVKVTKGLVVFNDYEKLKQQALEVADFVKNIIVTEDSIKEARKLVARSNKAVKELNDSRISIKKSLLESYDDFEKQVKEIQKIVDDASEIVKIQVRELDEKERENKKEEIKEIWDKRIDLYNFAKMIKFEDFLTQQHLNKTTTMKKVEEEMVEFLEKKETDLEVLSNMENSEELISTYLEVKDVSLAIQIVESRKKQEEEIKKFREKLVTETVKEKQFAFVVSTEKDKKFVEMLLNENKIEFELKEI